MPTVRATFQLALEYPVAVATLSRPRERNAINFQVAHELDEVITAVESDPQVRALVITGGVQYFASGIDVEEVAKYPPDQLIETMRAISAVINRLPSLAKPVVGAVSGYCLGSGLELALACDVLISSPTTIFGLPEVSLALCPSAGSIARLIRLIGPNLAREMLLAGTTMDAKTAATLGLVNRIVPADSVREEALNLARRLATKSPLVLATLKRLAAQAPESTQAQNTANELDRFARLASTFDHQEAKAAFLEKRKPVYRGA